MGAFYFGSKRNFFPLAAFKHPMALQKAARFVFLLVTALGSAAITLGSVVYFNDDELAPFIIEKLPLTREELYISVLKVHVVAAAFTLPGCLLLSLSVLIRRAPKLHRWLGRAVGGAVLLALAPSGFYLSLFAKGGLPSTLGFVLSGLIVVAAMVQGIRTARARQFATHRRFVMHVLAQLSVAVISRAMLFAFNATPVDPELAYIVSLWGPVLGCAAFVELWTHRISFHPRRNHEVIRPVVSHAFKPVVGTINS